MDTLTPIPTPPAQRWREFRIQTLPVVTFLVVMVCVGMLWKQYVLPTNIIGEVEAVRANLISTVPGTLKELKVSRFDRVTNGQVVAVISTMDTETFQASLRSIEADLKLMRARMQLDMERNAATYEGMRLDLLQERVDLAIERVNNKFYESEVIRQRQLLTNTPVLIDMTTYEYWVRLAETTRTNIVEREKYLAEKEKTLPVLAPGTKADEAIVEAIRAQEEKLRAEVMTISLKSPIDGMVSFVLHAQGEKVVANMPLITISAVSSTRIIGYVRKPFSNMPKPGDTVQIRRQTFKRESAQATVLEVSSQLEPITSTLVPAQAGVKVELGLAFAISMPAELALIPGEPVDLIFGKK